MENKDIMVSVPLDQYQNGIAAMARIEAFSAYLSHEKYTIDRDMAALMLGFQLQGTDEEDENERIR